MKYLSSLNEFKTKIEEKKWDYVVLQEQTDQALNTNTSEFSKGAQSILDSAKSKNSKVKLIYNAVWVLNDYSIEDYTVTTKNYETVRDETQKKAIISYSGNAFLKSHSLYPDITLFSDERHPNLTGSYLSACCLYAALYKKSPEGIKYYAGVDKETANKMQQIAAETMGVGQSTTEQSSETTTNTQTSTTTNNTTNNTTSNTTTTTTSNTSGYTGMKTFNNAPRLYIRLKDKEKYDDVTLEVVDNNGIKSLTLYSITDSNGNKKKIKEMKDFTAEDSSNKKLTYVLSNKNDLKQKTNSYYLEVEDNTGNYIKTTFRVCAKNNVYMADYAPRVINWSAKGNNVSFYSRDLGGTKEVKIYDLNNEEKDAVSFKNLVKGSVKVTLDISTFTADANGVYRLKIVSKDMATNPQKATRTVYFKVSQEAASSSNTVQVSKEPVEQFLEVLEEISQKVQSDGNWYYSKNGTSPIVSQTYSEAISSNLHNLNSSRYISWALKEIGVLGSEQNIEKLFDNNKDAIRFLGVGAKSAIENSAEILYQANKKASNLIANGKLKEGDICLWNNKTYMSVYAGDNKWYDAESGVTNTKTVNGYRYSTLGPLTINSLYNYKGGVAWIIRLKTIAQREDNYTNQQTTSQQSSTASVQSTEMVLDRETLMLDKTHYNEATLQLTLGSALTDKTVTWKSSNSNVVKIVKSENQSVKIKSVSEGSAKITATVVTDNNKTIKAECKLTVFGQMKKVTAGTQGAVAGQLNTKGYWIVKKVDWSTEQKESYINNAAQLCLTGNYNKYPEAKAVDSLPYWTGSPHTSGNGIYGTLKRHTDLNKEVGISATDYIILITTTNQEINVFHKNSNGVWKLVNTCDTSTGAVSSGHSRFEFYLGAIYPVYKNDGGRGNSFIQFSQSGKGWGDNGMYDREKNSGMYIPEKYNTHRAIHYGAVYSSGAPSSAGCNHLPYDGVFYKWLNETMKDQYGTRIIVY